MNAADVIREHYREAREAEAARLAATLAGTALTLIAQHGEEAAATVADLRAVRTGDLRWRHVARLIRERAPETHP